MDTAEYRSKPQLEQSLVVAGEPVSEAEPITLNGLRQAAVLLQADAPLIIKLTSYADWNFRVGANKAKGISSLVQIPAAVQKFLSKAM